MAAKLPEVGRGPSGASRRPGKLAGWRTPGSRRHRFHPGAV